MAVLDDSVELADAALRRGAAEGRPGLQRVRHGAERRWDERNLLREGCGRLAVPVDRGRQLPPVRLRPGTWDDAHDVHRPAALPDPLRHVEELLRRAEPG